MSTDDSNDENESDVDEMLELVQDDVPQIDISQLLDLSRRIIIKNDINDNKDLWYL